MLGHLTGHDHGVTTIDPAFIEGQISENPACGTAMCFAGHTAVLAGARPILSLTDYERSGNGGRVGVPFATVMLPDSDETKYVDTYAAGLLGLDTEDADDLFSATNTLEDLQHLVAEIVEHDEIVSGKCRPDEEEGEEVAWPWSDRACGRCAPCIDYASRQD